MRRRRGQVAEGALQPQELDELLVLYRVVLTVNRESDAWLTSFQSREARGLPPRANTPEERDPRVNAGISMYRTTRAAASQAVAARERDRGFGDFVAKVELRPDEGFQVAEWGYGGHFTVWGEAVKLAACATDIVPIDDVAGR